MTSQPGSQTIAIHLLPSVSQSKGYQTIKLGQNFFFKTYAENEAERLVPDPFFVF